MAALRTFDGALVQRKGTRTDFQLLEYRTQCRRRCGRIPGRMVGGVLGRVAIRFLCSWCPGPGGSGLYSCPLTGYTPVSRLAPDRRIQQRLSRQPRTIWRDRAGIDFPGTSRGSGSDQQVHLAAGLRQFLRIHHPLQYARLGPHVPA